MDEKEIKQRFEDHERRLRTIEEKLDNSKYTNEINTLMEKTPQISFEKFVSMLNLKKHEDRAAAIAYFLYEYKNENFSLKKLSEYNQKVGWESYSNPTVLIKRLKKKHYIEQIKTEGEAEYRTLAPCITFIKRKLHKSEKLNDNKS